MSRKLYLPLGGLLALFVGGLFVLKDKLGSQQEQAHQPQAPLISRYAPPGHAENHAAPSSERQPVEIIRSSEPPRLLSAAEKDQSPVEVKLEPPQPSLPASRIVLTGAEESPAPTAPPPAPAPREPEPAAPVPAPPAAPMPPPPGAPFSPPTAPFPAPPAPAYTPPPPPIPSPPMTPPPAVSFPQNPSPVPTAIGCPWILKMEIVEGRSKVEARTENGINLKIACERLSVRSPDGDIEATGNVAFSSSSLEGSCERLTLSWRDSQISLNGKVRLKGKQEEQEVDLAGDHLTFKLAPSGRAKKEINSTAAPTPVPSRSDVIPAGGIMPASTPLPPRPEPMAPRPEPVPPSGPLSVPPSSTPPPPASEATPPANGNGLVPGTSQNLPRPSGEPMPGVRESRTPGGSSQVPAVSENRTRNTAPTPAPAVSESRSPSSPVSPEPRKPIYVSR
jgi:hypothetical protein